MSRSEYRIARRLAQEVIDSFEPLTKYKHSVDGKKLVLSGHIHQDFWVGTYESDPLLTRDIEDRLKETIADSAKVRYFDVTVKAVKVGDVETTERLPAGGSFDVDFDFVVVFVMGDPTLADEVTAGIGDDLAYEFSWYKGRKFSSQEPVRGNRAWVARELVRVAKELVAQGVVMVSEGYYDDGEDIIVWIDYAPTGSHAGKPGPILKETNEEIEEIGRKYGFEHEGPERESKGQGRNIFRFRLLGAAVAPDARKIKGEIRTIGDLLGWRERKPSR